MAAPVLIGIFYDADRVDGRLVLETPSASPIWNRIRQSAAALTSNYSPGADTIRLDWPAILSIIREYSRLQKSLDFRFRAGNDEARERIARFTQQYQQVRAAAREAPQALLSTEEIETRLIKSGFTKRKLKDFQVRDLQRLIALSNGANFSVPGAGKTTVTLALELLTRKPSQHLLVIGPKASFPAWREVVDECMSPDAPNNNAEQFTILGGSADQIRRVLQGGGTRFVINYDLVIQIPSVISEYLATQPVHLVLDESHRMKAGLASMRGAFLLGVADLPVRRDILSGTPMPQGPNDIQSQLDFLWPGSGLGGQIARGDPPRTVLGNLYVRTTKQDLGLPDPIRHFEHVGMADGQMALYGIVKNEFLRQASMLRFESRVDLPAARRSIMRLLQLSANPTLVLRSIMDDALEINSRILDKVIAEGPSTKMRAVADKARALAKEGRKSVIWTIFTDTIQQMEGMLADLNPVSLYGAVPSGEPTDPSTREGRIVRFHVDPKCQVLIANPAAAGEGISLHHAAHDAIYLDRSYVSTHYLQSIDRIHRLGLKEGVETHIWIYQTLAPAGLGCIDDSVSRRLAQKLRALQQLLNDPDLHKIALDEENAEDPIAWDIDPEDVRDLIEELEGKVAYDEESGE